MSGGENWNEVRGEREGKIGIGEDGKIGMRGDGMW